MHGSRVLVAERIGRNSSSVFATSVRVKRLSTAKYSTFTRQVLTTIQKVKKRHSFSKWCKTKFTTLPTNKPLQRLFILAQMPGKILWDSLHLQAPCQYEAR